ncbi:MAG: hypothetical protein M0R80_01060 [Proteobacteria bacterium]|jgi:hypothetical protein|nr:hypothetical protein [Pseudomonadota bacterium]
MAEVKPIFGSEIKYSNANNQLSRLQNLLNQTVNITPVLPPVSGIMALTIIEKSNNKLSQLQSQLDHIHNIAQNGATNV